MPSFDVTAIGVVRSSRAEAVDDDWDSIRSEIIIDHEQFGTDAVAGLEAFSHVEVVYLFDKVDPRSVETGARHPRGNTAWPEVGIFAQRARARPNRIGTTVCRLLAVDGLTVSVHGLDAIDGTPVLDVKPYLPDFGPRGDVRQPAWSGELMSSYWVQQP